MVELLNEETKFSEFVEAEILLDGRVRQVDDVRVREVFLVDSVGKQDNAHPHVAKTVRDFCSAQHMQLLPWPACSPDMSPIEHLWDLIGRVSLVIRVLKLQKTNFCAHTSNMEFSFTSSLSKSV
ncbi:hypothetical protein TNCV_1312251 [Trichonephila clavipes]|nr:hypothetical protein TNCV_1312251 [Trichonephila clavipes]